MSLRLHRRLRLNEARIDRIGLAVVESASIRFILKASRLVQRLHSVCAGLQDRIDIEAMRDCLIAPNGALQRHLQEIGR